MLATPGQLLVNEALPPELRDYSRTLGQDEINSLLERLAREHPERYREVCWRLVQLGRNAAFDEGSTITLNDLVPVVDKRPLLDLVRRQERAILADRRLTQAQKDEAIETLYGEATKRLTDETYANALANNNPFAIQAKYKARGNKNQLGAMLTSPGTYTDSSGKIVPIFIGSSYAEGLKPHEYWAAGYGARLGVVSTKLGTQKGGYLSKMMNAAAIDQVVTEDDCGTTNGIPVPVDDNDSVGSVLQGDVAGFKAGTVITKKVLDAIRDSGEDEIVVRSPITCGCKNGLCKKCVGIRETGRFPDIGYNVGVNAASALGEQIAQNALNTKHQGRRDDLGAYVGFDALKNLTTVPKAYDVKASVAPADGTVSSIEDAPQGGKYVVMDDESGSRVYVPPALEVSVRPGDRLEAGDAVSSGLVSPADVVAYKGIGEGRRYFTDSFTKTFRNSKYGVNRRNVEVLSRALVNNVQVENPDSEGDALPGDILRYSAWAAGYKPRDGATSVSVDKAMGQYLEAPALHYTIGTRVTPSVAKRLKRHGIKDIPVNSTAPGVVPHMVSAVESPAYSGDWMARLGTSYLKDRLLEDAQHGAHSELHSTNPIPSLAKGVELGRDISTKGEY